MENENPRHPSDAFDENAALEELDRLQEEIRQVRRQREQKVEEFEAWVRETRTASRAERVAALEGEASTSPAAAARTANRAAEPSGQSGVSTAAPAAESERDWTAFDDDFQQDRWRADEGFLRGRRAYYAAGVAAVLIGVAILVRTLSNGSPEPPSSLNVGQPTATQPATPQPAEKIPPRNPGQAAASAPTTAGRALQIELTTIRPVWMRVTVDGERRVEREVPAGQRLSFGADRTIVVRAGDGGGVRLSIAGRDMGLLGRDGRVADRTLTPSR